MQVFALLPLLTTFAATTVGVSAALVGSAGPVHCASETISHEGFIGKDNNVKFSVSHCNDAPHVAANGVELTKRQTSNGTVDDVCGAPCAYHLHGCVWRVVHVDAAPLRRES